MHRTNLNIDQQLINKVKKVSGEKTMTRTIHYALKYVLKDGEKQKAIESLRALRGSKIWEGDLNKMRKSRV